ncbi:MAG: DUF1273 domain-containing protein [Oscillospiraceae bacterium]|nr:DUF1273 domain-containing protein [Oscillospiraceae bacterium]
MKDKKNRCIISGIDVSLLPFGYNEDSRDCQIIKNNMLNKIAALHREGGVDEFYTNCNYGFPLWGGEIVTGLMRYNDIRLYVMYAYENQPYTYTANWRDRFHKVHENSTDVILTYIDYDAEDNRVFSKDTDVLIKRAADYMLEDCGRLLFCGTPEQAAGDYIYEQALERGLEIIALNMEGEST